MGRRRAASPRRHRRSGAGSAAHRRGDGRYPDRQLPSGGRTTALPGKPRKRGSQFLLSCGSGSFRRRNFRSAICSRALAATGNERSDGASFGAHRRELEQVHARQLPGRGETDFAKRREPGSRGHFSQRPSQQSHVAGGSRSQIPRLRAREIAVGAPGESHRQSARAGKNRVHTRADERFGGKGNPREPALNVPRTTKRAPTMMGGVILSAALRNNCSRFAKAWRYDNQIGDIFMKRYVPLTLFFLTTLLTTAGFCQKLRPVTLGLTGKSLTTLIFEMSIRRGHFKQQGLDVKLITIRQSDVIIKATMAGELNLMSVIPTAILASVRGLPIRTIAVNVDNAPYVLVGRPQIKSMNDLKGKKIAVSSLGGMSTLVVREIVARSGL